MSGTTSILSFGTAFPSLRLPASAIAAVWGGGGSRGLQRKPFCAFDEDVISLGIAAARSALSGSDGAGRIGALFVGSTALPYEEKPSSATIATAVLGRATVRTVEVRGSCQAGLQALLLASEYCRSHPGSYALAIATDAPAASPQTAMEHPLSAGAAAFLVGIGDGVARFEADAAVTIETFGSRFRRMGERFVSDLELRTSEQANAIRALSAAFKPGAVANLAAGVSADAGKGLVRAFGGTVDELWSKLGDAGAAAAPIALAHVLETAAPDSVILTAAVSSGATALTLKRSSAALPQRSSVTDQLSAGTEVDYIAYLKHRRLIGSPELAAP